MMRDLFGSSRSGIESEVGGFLEVIHFAPESIVVDEGEHGVQEIMRHCNNPEIQTRARAIIRRYVPSEKGVESPIGDVSLDLVIPCLKELYLIFFQDSQELIKEAIAIVGKMTEDANAHMHEAKAFLEKIGRHHEQFREIKRSLYRTCTSSSDPGQPPAVKYQFNRVDAYLSSNIGHDTSGRWLVFVSALNYLLKELKQKTGGDALAEFEKKLKQNCDELRLMCSILKSEEVWLNGTVKVESDGGGQDLREKLENMGRVFAEGKRYAVRNPDTKEALYHYEYRFVQSEGEFTPETGTIQIYFDPAFEDAPINVDCVITEVFNAVKNSIKAVAVLNEGPRRERKNCIFISCAKKDNAYEVSIKDTGIGFPSEKTVRDRITARAATKPNDARSLLERMLLHPIIRGHLTQRFIYAVLLQRSTESSFSEVGGTGIGLSKMYQLTKADGGYIELLDVPSGGVEVRLVFPVDGGEFSNASDRRLTRLYTALKEVGFPGRADSDNVAAKFYNPKIGWVEVCATDADEKHGTDKVDEAGGYYKKAA